MAKKSGSGDAMSGGTMSGSMMPKGMMAGEKGMSPRKAIAGMGEHEANTGTGGFGVKSFDEAQGHAGHHPDRMAATGGNHLEDHERGIGHPIHHTKHHHPAQAAPHHGPHHVDGYGDHHGGGHHAEGHGGKHPETREHKMGHRVEHRGG